MHTKTEISQCLCIGRHLFPTQLQWPFPYCNSPKALILCHTSGCIVCNAVSSPICFTQPPLSTYQTGQSSSTGTRLSLMPSVLAPRFGSCAESDLPCSTIVCVHVYSFTLYAVIMQCISFARFSIVFRIRRDI